MLATLRNTQIFFDIAGMKLAPSKKGLQSRPVLFLLHGGPGGSHLRYKQTSIELQEVAQLVFIDHRGCGFSKKAKKNEYTLENNIEDIEALRQYLGFEKICLLGTSYGGVVAQGYAIRYSNKLEKLILVATAPSYRFIDEAKQFLQQYATPHQIKICEKLWNGTFKNPEEVKKFFNDMDSLYSVKKTNTKNNVSKNEIVWNHEALNKGFRETLRNYDYLSQLKKIKCPTLVLAGREDWICSAQQSKMIAKNIPHAKLKIFNQCAHAIATDAHKAYLKLIKNFLQNSH